MPVWRTALVQESREFEIPLYILEESVENSETPFCAHCRVSAARVTDSSVEAFGAKQAHYEAAVEILSSIELDEITRDFNTASFNKDYKIIIDYHIDFSQTKLITFRDLLKYMRTLKSTIPQRSANVAHGREYPHVAVRPRLQHVADVVVDALKEKKERFNCGMTRQEAYHAATASLRIDYNTKDHWRDRVLVSEVLKDMDDVVVGGMKIRSRWWVVMAASFGNTQCVITLRILKRFWLFYVMIVGNLAGGLGFMLSSGGGVRFSTVGGDKS
ncbi:hypothetical protein RHMOL_Rhmol10G0287800 [Rhododendron molle]|uniref:Uncharacterized protein n=1 Tax=Rhododendron molle TaxID=49168 RepID=A0ACC0M732_RHOML|nr:hypothetical protein RHMOL_Rhmol10G0287800 [Rhododendron molle]